MRSLVLITLLGFSATAFADGPGSRIRATPGGPPQPSGAMTRDMDRCDEMRGEQKERCLRALGAAARAPARTPNERPGPEATGGGTNAGTGASSGTSGASSASGSAR